MSTPKSIGNLLNNNVLKLNGLLNTKKPEIVQSEKTEANKYIHPILTKENIRNSIALYSRYIEKYNARVRNTNLQVKQYNSQVISHRRKAFISFEQKLKEGIWKEQHKSLSPEAYNKAVESYNLEHGPQIRKVKLLQEVRPESKQYFVAFLHQYNMQLFNRKKLRCDLQVHVPGELPKLELYPNKIIDAERDGAKNLPVTVETIRAHRERLEEAGVLTGYEYHGSTRPLKIAFCEEVLSLTDNGLPKSAENENQALIQIQTKKVHHNNVSSRIQSLEETKYREEGAAANAPAQKDCTKKSTGTPRRQGGKNFNAGDDQAGNPQKKFTAALEKNELSAVLTSSLLDKIELAQDLSAGNYKKYKPLAAKIAKQEAYYGAMHPEDFKELAIQDIFKYAAILFSSLEVHPGSWVNAYKIWIKEKFQNFNGQTLSKPNMFSQWQKAIEVLRQVKKYSQNHKEWQPLYPSRYFDPAFTYKENNSFEYAYRFFKLDQEKVDSYQKRRIQAEKSLRYKTDTEKAREQIRKFINGRIELQLVYDYVKYNCNREVYRNINALIKTELENMQKYFA
ncbi:hypothetical protein [Zunongwangia sp. HGR-M22]|uniref:hypothetical protein n=1 Tax=Zunongwangia sp. HGR-M22 TaxID=3015168 RepID=UPI0022DE0B23|nr:hypothetical protein [Zunongwangia sp. HGR-M22]WBL25092.1 hypothetical protein PBT91_14460 [Zunongwangia sp. HGR-M22]